MFNSVYEYLITVYYQLDVHNLRSPNYDRQISFTSLLVGDTSYLPHFVVEMQTMMAVEHVLLYLQCELCKDERVEMNYVTYRRSRDRAFQISEKSQMDGKEGTVSS